MTNTTFETKVLTQLDDINGRLDAIDGRLDKIEFRVSGAEDDPHNRGIYGALTVVTGDVEAIKKRHRELTKDIGGVEEEQTRQKAWNKGAAAGAGINAVGVVAVLMKLSGTF